MSIFWIQILVLIFQIKIKTKTSTSQTKTGFFSGIASMLNQQEFSDITFMVEGKPFYGHKIIIS